MTPAAVAVLVSLLAACASQIAAPPVVERRGPADFPDAYYRRLLSQAKPVFRVDPVRSLVVIEVRRAGSLAQFGHDHVVASHDVAGIIAPDEGRADLYLPLDALVVDEPVLRAEAGFDTQPSAADIAGTRRNMLEKVLETDRHPYALIAVNDLGAGGSARQLRVALTLHGTTSSVDAATQFERAGEEVSVTGTLAIDQSRFGIAPFSVLGGAIAVQDRVNITFRIRARRVE
ncbi:MAG: YceI family protein [Aromatoleum sp.]|nr:YceI family protein [Aromatoleum sp.]